MTEAASTIARRVAVADGTVAFVFPFVLLASELLRLSTSSLAKLGVAALMLALLVGWRGLLQARRELAGHGSRFRLVLEGFGFGFVPSAVWLIGLAANTAMAAGTGYDGAADWGASEWLDYIVTSLQISLFPGALGAALGLIISFLNRWLLRAAV